MCRMSVFQLQHIGVGVWAKRGQKPADESTGTYLFTSSRNSTQSRWLIWKKKALLVGDVCHSLWEHEGLSSRQRHGRWGRGGLSSGMEGDYVPAPSCVLTFRMLLGFSRPNSGFTDYTCASWIHYSEVVDGEGGRRVWRCFARVRRLEVAAPAALRKPTQLRPTCTLGNISISDNCNALQRQRLQGGWQNKFNFGCLFLLFSMYFFFLENVWGVKKRWTLTCRKTVC